MAFWNWSRTASANATATGGTWAEGMAPSAVNDSVRINAAELACYRDDIAGAIITAGSSTAYTVASYSVFTSLAVLNGQMIAFSPHTTNGAGPVLLNVDGLGQKPLRSSPGVELQAGVLIQGTPYIATFNNSDGAYYLQNFFGASPYLVPLSAGMDYWGLTAPNSSFAFPMGQAISRTTYSALFALIGGEYGGGDGTTTFNLPDKRGRVSAMQETSASLLTSSYFGGNSTQLGAVGGGESQTLTLGQLPTGITSPGTFALSISNVVTAPVGFTSYSANSGAQVWSATSPGNFVGNNSVTASGTATSSNTGGGAHRTVQPTIISGYIMRII